MKLDAKGIAFIQQAEGFSSYAYVCAAGKKTIGFGHVIRANDKIQEPISVAEATQLLLTDVEVYEAAVNSLELKLSQNQFNALVSLCYNIGVKAFLKSTLMRKLKAGKFKEAESEFLRWRFIRKQESKGLLQRREKELALWRL